MVACRCNPHAPGSAGYRPFRCKPERTVVASARRATAYISDHEQPRPGPRVDPLAATHESPGGLEESGLGPSIPRCSIDHPRERNLLSEPLLIEPRDGVLVITINRPEAKNAVDARVAKGIAAALDDFENNDTLGVAVLTGAGDTFCAGMDLKAFSEGESVASHRGMLGGTRRPPAKPIIAAVEGWALAGGCELALACDLIVAAEDAKFGVPEVKRGIIAAAGGLLRLPLALPYHVAMELVLTGEPISAPRAHSLGMVNRLVAPGAALQGALELAAVVLRNGPLAVRTSKQIMSTAIGWENPEFWRRQQDQVDAILSSQDALEGARAFAERREPKWSLR